MGKNEEKQCCFNGTRGNQSFDECYGGKTKVAKDNKLQEFCSIAGRGELMVGGFV